MAFNNAKASAVGTTETTVYTVPTGKTATIIGLCVANVSAGSISVTAKLGTTHIIKTATVPVGTSLVAIGGDQKVVALAGEAIKITSSVASSADVIISVLEQ